jgi:lipoprotein-anchoring transpeptidase ErfK/SrfK
MPSPARHKRRAVPPGVAAAVVLVGAVVVAVLAMVVSGVLDTDDAVSSSPGAAPGGAKQPDGARSAVGRTPIAVVKRRTELRASPDGRRMATIGTRTEFKSARVLAVVGERPGWLRVMDAELKNGQTGWIQASDAQRGMVDYKLKVDLSARRLEVLKDGRVIRRIRTAVGEQGTPTPTGRFAVTDKVPFRDRGSPYGCCALALTAHQPNTPSEWTGGDRIAIHATPARASIGRSVTLGCMRVPDPDAEWMMKQVPLGTPVSIRS